MKLDFAKALAVIPLLGSPAFPAEPSVRDAYFENLKGNRKGKLDSAYFSILGFRIGKANLYDDVRKTLGQADDRHPENGPVEICYRAKDPADDTRVAGVRDGVE